MLHPPAVLSRPLRVGALLLAIIVVFLGVGGAWDITHAPSPGGQLVCGQDDTNRGCPVVYLRDDEAWPSLFFWERTPQAYAERGR